MDLETFIYRSFTITFLVVGSITNILSAIIYSKKKMRKTSYSFYLFALAIADLSVTLTGNLRLALIYYRGNSLDLLSDVQHSRLILYDIREHSLIACRLHRFLTYYFLQLSSVILCLLNLDRFCGCVLILKAAKFCKPSIARRAVLFSMIFLFLIDSHFLFAMGDFDTTTTASNITITKFKCKHNENNLIYSYFWDCFIYIDVAIYCVIPFIIMITCNFMIISKIIRSRIKSKQVVVSKKKNTIVRNSSAMLSNEKRISFILIGISVSFLLLTVPVFVIENFQRPKIANWNIISAFAYLFMYLNHVINFFFYCFLGPRFRREIKELLFCCLLTKKKKPLHFATNNNNMKIVDVVVNEQEKDCTIQMPPIDTNGMICIRNKRSMREKASRLLFNTISQSLLTTTTTSKSTIMLSRQQSFNISTNRLNLLKKSSSVFECSSLLITSGLIMLNKNRPSVTTSSIEFNA